MRSYITKRFEGCRSPILSNLSFAVSHNREIQILRFHIIQNNMGSQTVLLAYFYIKFNTVGVR